jgi:hypothetical protein
MPSLHADAEACDQVLQTARAVLGQQRGGVACAQGRAMSTAQLVADVFADGEMVCDLSTKQEPGSNPQAVDLAGMRVPAWLWFRGNV